MTKDDKKELKRKKGEKEARKKEKVRGRMEWRVE